MDEECLADCAGSSDVLITVEESSLIGGFGEGVLDCLNRSNLLKDKKLISLGLPDRFIDHGSVPELLHALELDAEGLAATAREAMSAGRAPMGEFKILPPEDEVEAVAQDDAELKLKET